MRANIYIRKENEEAWEKLQDKSHFVNDALLVRKTDIGATILKTPKRDKNYPKNAIDEVKHLQGLTTADLISPPSKEKTYIKNLDLNTGRPAKTCEHGAIKKQCYQPKCKNRRRNEL